MVVTIQRLKKRLFLVIGLLVIGNCGISTKFYAQESGQQASRLPESTEFKNYYAVLGVPFTADDDAIRKAYRARSLKWHPDRNLNEEEKSKRLFQLLGIAYETLSDSEKRKRYDAELMQQQTPPSQSAADDGQIVPSEQAENKPEEKAPSKTTTNIGKIVANIREAAARNNGVITLKDYIGNLISPYEKFIPQDIYSALMNNNLSKVELSDQLAPEEEASYGTDAVIVRGRLEFERTSLVLRILFFNDTTSINTKMAVSVALELPGVVRLSDFIKGFTSFDRIKFKNSTLAFSSAGYKDETLGVTLGEKQFTFISRISFAEQEVDDFNNLQTLMKKTGNSLIQYVDIKTVIASDPLKTKISFAVPFNLQKTYAPGSSITKIAADTLNIDIEPGKVAFDISMGMAMYLATQKLPLMFRMGGKLSKTELKVYGLMDGMYDPAFGVDWLALGNFGVELDFNFALMSTGIPISGIGFRGDMGFGESNDRMLIGLAAKVDISSNSIPDIGLEANINEIDLGLLLSVLKKKTGKSKNTGDTPVIKFEDLNIKVMPTDVEIAGKEYKKGLEAKGYLDIAGIKGYGHVQVLPDTAACTVKGALSKIQTKNVTIAGPGLPGVIGMEDGPSLIFDMALNDKPVRQPQLTIGGEIFIDPIKWSAKAKFIASATKLYANVETTIGQNFEAQAEISLPLTEMAKFSVLFRAKIDFAQTIKLKMHEYAQKEKAEIQKDYIELDKKIKNFQIKLENKIIEEQEQVKARLAKQAESYVIKLQAAERKMKEKLQKLILAQQEVQRDKMACKQGQVAKCFEIIGSGLKMVAADAAYEMAKMKIELLDSIAAIKEIAIQVEGDVYARFYKEFTDLIEELNIAKKIKDTRLALLEASTLVVDALTAFSIKSFSIKVAGEDIAKGKIATGSLEWAINVAGVSKTGTWEGAIDFANPIEFAKNFYKQIGEQIVGIKK